VERGRYGQHEAKETAKDEEAQAEEAEKGAPPESEEVTDYWHRTVFRIDSGISHWLASATLL